MISSEPRLGGHLGSRSRSEAGRFAHILQGFYTGLMEQGVPEHLAGLVRQLTGESAQPGADGRKVAIVVEPDDHVRAMASVLLEESGLAVVECISGEAALSVMQHRAGDVVFIFADENLAGVRDGLSLAGVVAKLWPKVHVVLTADLQHAAANTLPDSVVALGKPWRGLDVLIEAEKALTS